MDYQTAYLILNLLPGIGPIKVKQLLTHFQSPEKIFSASPSQINNLPGIGPKLADIIIHWQNFCDIEAEKKSLQLAGIGIVTLSDDDYPDTLREIHDSPILLYVAGNKKILNNKKCLAVVGSRYTTHYGQQNTIDFVKDAITHDWTIVSGLARGIDTIAHETACKFSGTTIAVIGSGLNQLYPPENISLAKKIVETGGAVISEFPLRTKPDKRTFPMRNRIISGLCAGTLVVEAGFNSGSLITANSANEQGRLVFAVPGHIDSPQSKGCHEIIRKGSAILVESFEHILEELSTLPGFVPSVKSLSLESIPNTNTKPIVDIDHLSLTDLEKKLFKQLYVEREAFIDNIMTWVDFPPGQILASLVSLEIKGLIKQVAGRKVIILKDMH